MARTATYNTIVQWKGEHWGHIHMGNGPEMDFSAPPDAQGHAGVLTRRCLQAAVNTCVLMMFIWSAERFKLTLYLTSVPEGTKLIELDRTEIFSQVLLKPRIVVNSEQTDKDAVSKRLRRAMDSAVKYSLVANSIKSKLVIEPQIEIVSKQ
jgi:organic hydroperoxide reductase OsmC/OhrA